MSKCNGCKNEFDSARGALSRYDNKTLVCSDCGQDEGVAQFAAWSYNIDPKSILLGAGQVDWFTLAGEKK